MSHPILGEMQFAGYRSDTKGFTVKLKLRCREQRQDHVFEPGDYNVRQNNAPRDTTILAAEPAARTAMAQRALQAECA